MKEYISVIKNYATFSGRARRREYWMFTLFNFIFAIVAAISDNIIGDTFKNPATGLSFGYGYVYAVYGLFVFIPGLAVLVRRLHDVGKSGKLLLMMLIVSIVSVAIAVFMGYNGGQIFVPLLLMVVWLGICIWLLVLACTDSTVGPNKYGPNPKGIGNIDDFDFMSAPDADN